MAADFDEDLRAVLRRAGCKNEKIVFILDESNILESSFLERMNTLLANGEEKKNILWIEIYGGGGFNVKTTVHNAPWNGFSVQKYLYLE